MSVNHHLSFICISKDLDQNRSKSIYYHFFPILTLLTFDDQTDILNVIFKFF